MKRACLIATTVLAALSLEPAFAELWKLEPGVTTRGKKPETWIMDLRHQTHEAAAAAAAKLSTRLYGKTESSLHHPLEFLCDFPAAKVFAFDLAAVSSGGSDLVLKTNGGVAGRQTWPRAASSHRLNRILYIPLGAGSNTVSLEVTQPSGVVVIDRYLIADSVAQLPQNSVLMGIDSAPVAGTARSTADFADAPKTGGVLLTDDGFRGIWYYNQPSHDEYKFKYSGGFATYPYQHSPIAIYCKEVDKTFFVYGGTTARSAKDKQELLHMVSYFDHKTGKVLRPRILLNKHTIDAHDNPTLQVDDQGYLWIFSSSHGTGRPSYIHRSVKPWSVDEFECVKVTNFSYTQPWYVPSEGFLFLHTRYGGGKSLGINATRCLFEMSSPDGRQWSEPRMLAGIEAGDYQVSWRNGKRIATAFDFHPYQLGLNARANIYYMETDDLGRTWHNVRGEQIKLPLTDTNNAALVCNTRAEGLLAYLRDVNFDGHGHPVIMFVTSKGYASGPENGPRQWQTLRWTGSEWIRRPFTTSNNNYDHGSLYIEPDGTWRVIAPTEVGAQPYNPGGNMVLWTSNDEGLTWKRVKQLTHDPLRNHTFARRPLNAHPDFYAFWADGNGREPSESSLYFTNQKGGHVWQLPPKMEGAFASPAIVGD
jgi:hypothetical protein